jgi:hypothetical protein
MAYDVNQFLKMTPAELDALYGSSPPGPDPQRQGARHGPFTGDRVVRQSLRLGGEGLRPSERHTAQLIPLSASRPSSVRCTSGQA